MLNFPMIRQRALRLARSRPTLADVAVDQWTYCPGGERSTRSAHWLHDTAHRVKQVMPGSSFEHEFAKIAGAVSHDRANIAYRLRNATLFEGYIYKDHFKLPLVPHRERFASSTPLEQYEEAVVACSLNGNQYFGHWLTDDLPLCVAAAQFAQTVSAKIRQTRHQQQYAELLDVKPKQTMRGSFRDLIILDDIGQTEHKKSRYQYLRSLLRPLWGDSPPAGVMLLRGKTGQLRLLHNELAIADALAARGFLVISPEQHSVAELAGLIGGTSLVIGVEGSHLAHAFYTLADGGGLVTLQPHDRFHNIHKDITDRLDMRYGLVIGVPHQAGFEIAIDELLGVVDLF